MNDAKRTVAAQWTRTDKNGKKDTVVGTLVISSEIPTHLIHLSRDFADESTNGISVFGGLSEVNVYPLLHGQTEDGMYTAIDSREIRSSRSFGGGKLSDIVLQPSFLIKGSVALNEHELAITDVQLRFWDQDAWAQWYSLQLKNGTPEDRTVTIKQIPPPSHSLKVNGVEVSLHDDSQTAYFPFDTGKISISQTSVFHLKFDEEITLTDFFSKWMAPLSFWVSSGARRTSGVEAMSVHNKNWTLDSDGSPVTSWLTVIPRNPERKFKDDDKIRFLHRLKDFEFEKQLPIILDAAFAHETAIGQFLDYLHSPPGTPMVQLTVLAQLVETFDRSLDPDPLATDELNEEAQALFAFVAASDKFKKYASDSKRMVKESARPTLASRLKRLDTATGKIVGDMLKEMDWKSAVAEVRNAIVHGLPSSSFFLTNIIPIQVSVDILELLFEMRLLVAMGFTPDEMKAIVVDGDPNWYGRTHNVRSYLSSFEDFKSYVP